MFIGRIMSLPIPGYPLPPLISNNETNGTDTTNLFKTFMPISVSSNQMYYSGDLSRSKY